MRPLEPDRELSRFLHVRDQELPQRASEESWLNLKRTEACTFRRHLVGIVKDSIVAAGSITESAMLPNAVQARLTVDIGHRGQGLGRAMAAAIQSIIGERRYEWIETRVVDHDGASRAWAERRGFVVVDHGIRSRLTPDAFEYQQHRARIEAARDHGFVFEAADDGDRLYALYARLVDDVPDSLSAPDRAYFRRQVLEKPGALNLIARRGDEWAGLTLLTPVDADGAWVAFTGVLRQFRRRGLALSLKAVALDEAFRAGRRWIDTNNNALNAGILAVNNRLGFERLVGLLTMRKRLLT